MQQMLVIWKAYKHEAIKWKANTEATIEIIQNNIAYIGVRARALHDLAIDEEMEEFANHNITLSLFEDDYIKSLFR